MRRAVLVFLLTLASAWTLASGAHAAGGSYTFAGGTAPERATVRHALDASTFDWSVVPASITVHITRGIESYATPGEIWLDADLLDSGVFAWGPVQHEYAHQIDFFLLDDAKRAVLASALGAPDWCYGVAGLAHEDYGCERFASLLAWAYWQSASNSLRPAGPSDEAGHIAPAAFRTLLAQLIGARQTYVAAPGSKAYAPKAKPKPRPKQDRRKK